MELGEHESGLTTALCHNRTVSQPHYITTALPRIRSNRGTVNDMQRDQPRRSESPQAERNRLADMAELGVQHVEEHAGHRVLSLP